MSKILVSCISPTSVGLLNAYLDKFMPDAEIEPLKSFGIKGKMKTYAKRAEVALVIIDEILYNECVGVADEVLALPKVHKYVDDDGLKQFLISKFGRLDDDTCASNVGVSGDNSGIALSVPDEPDNLAFGDITHAHDADDMVEDLKEKLAQQGVIINNLELQLREAHLNDDASYYLEKIKSLGEQLKAKEEELNALRADNLEMKGSVSRSEQYLSELDELKNSLRKEKENSSALVYERDNTAKELSSLKAEYDKLIDEKNELLDGRSSDTGIKDAEISALQNKIDELSKELEEASALSPTLDAKELELNTLKKDYATNKEELNRLTAQVEGLNSGMDALKGALQAEQESGVLLQKKYDTDTNDLRLKLDATVKELTSAREDLGTLTDKDSEIGLLKSQIEGYKSSISTLRDSVSGLTEVVNKREKEIEGYNTTISELQSTLSALKADNEKLSLDLDSEVMENNNLLGKIEELESDTKSVSVLREKVSELEKALEGKSEEASDELMLVKQELKGMTNRCQELKIDIIQRDEQLEELSKGIFAQMSGVVTPKAEFNCRLEQHITAESGFLCVSSGSSGSLVDLYQLLYKSCICPSASNKKILILDLVTDSSIDKIFGCKQVISPLEWLMGGKGFEPFLASTKLSNVQVLSVALSYINDLFLLHVDWGKRLAELRSFYDTVVINVGVLLNVTTKILFNTFNRHMRSYIVVKATPINLRTVYLNTMGLRLGGNENVEVCCTNFDTASNIVYEKLRNKLKAVIYMDSDVLGL